MQYCIYIVTSQTLYVLPTFILNNIILFYYAGFHNIFYGILLYESVLLF